MVIAEVFMTTSDGNPSGLDLEGRLAALQREYAAEKERNSRLVETLRDARDQIVVMREEIERRRTRLNDELQREQNGWREAQQALAGERAGLQAEVLRLRERELQDRITDSQRIFRNRSQAIEQAAQAALVEIEQALGTVIRLVAQSRNVNIMLPRPLVIMNEPAFDLTEEIAQQFNRNLPRVTIQAESDGRNPPAPPAAAAGARPAAAPPAAPAGGPPAATAPVTPRTPAR
jgi:Skp family chaperone for outer membrane proteins